MMRMRVADYPQLGALCWNRPGVTDLAPEEAFGLYERNWPLVDQDRLTPAEIELIGRLTAEHGAGVFLRDRRFWTQEVLGDPDGPFRRPQHNAVHRVLRALDADLIRDAGLRFGGGTAIALLLEEYRDGADICLIYSARDSGRILNGAVAACGVRGLFRPDHGLEVVRDLMQDRGRMLAAVRADGARVRVQIIPETRMDPDNDPTDIAFGVPVMSTADLFAQKLMANADRWNRPEALGRDIIDLGALIAEYGPIPDLALAKARQAYGDAAERAYEHAVLKLHDRKWLGHCLATLGLEARFVPLILRALEVPDMPATGQP